MTFKKVLLLIAVMLSACSPRPAEGNTCDSGVRDVSHVFVVSAFGIEDAAVKGHVEVLSTCTNDKIVYTLAKYDNREIVIYESGVGNFNADITTERTLKNFKVEMLVFSGISGGLDPNLKIGDTVVPSKWFDLKSGQSVRVDQNLLDIAKTMNGTSLSFPDSGITSPEFVSDPGVVKNIQDKFGSSIVDMETYEVAAVAHNIFVPFIAFRSVSDFANGQKDKSHYQVAAESSANYAFAFLKIYFSQPKTP